MSEAKRDENRVTVGLAWDGSTTQPLLIDAATGRLLIEITTVTSTTPETRENAAHDQNHVPSALAWDGTDEQNLLIDNRNGSFVG